MTQPQSQIPPEPPGDSVRGFLPDHEGQQLYEWAQQAAPIGPLLEIGSYCGKSTIWLGQAAKAHGTVVFALDHHRGSEEHQPGESHHDEALVNTTGQFDTFGEFRRNIGQLASKIPLFRLLPAVRSSAPTGRAGLGWFSSTADTVWMPH